jgi:hypothetical protein
MGHLLPLIDALPNALISGSNTYGMLSHPDTVRAISLSSGTLAEASLLGLEAQALILPDRDNRACLPAGLTDWIEVDDALFSPATLAAFVTGSAHETPALRGAGLIEARMGASLNTLANAQSILQAPHLQPGRSYALGTNGGSGPASLGCLQFGWSSPEPWGVWSEGQVASLAFRITSGAPCRLILTGSLFHHQLADYPFRPDIEACVSVGGHACPVTLQVLETDWQVTVDLSDALTDVPVFVHFLIAGACAPSLLGVNTDRRKLGLGLHGIEIAQGPNDHARQTQTQNAVDYSGAHRDIDGYRENNWMAPYARPLRALGLNSVIECACGNGEFSEVLAPNVTRFYAMDWAASPFLPHSTPGFQHLHWDAYTDTLPKADLLCSADFLEHIREAQMDAVLGRMLSAAPRQFHVIACYDDYHSHLTIEPPEWWLARLMQIARDLGLPSDWQLMNWAQRDAERSVAVVCNFVPELLEHI